LTERRTYKSSGDCSLNKTQKPSDLWTVGKKKRSEKVVEGEERGEKKRDDGEEDKKSFYGTVTKYNN